MDQSNWRALDATVTVVQIRVAEERSGEVELSVLWIGQRKAFRGGRIMDKSRHQGIAFHGHAAEQAVALCSHRGRFLPMW
jgi:hypothetical protein